MDSKRGFNVALLTFCILALFDATVNAQTPSSVDGKTLLITITSGAPPKLASSGKLALVLSDAGNTYHIYGLTPNITDESGTFSYVKNSETNATLTLTQGTNVFTVSIKFTTVAGGSYRLTASGVTGTQVGTFQLFNGPAPVDPSNRIFDLTATSGAAPFIATGHFRMYLHGDGSYLLKNIGNGQTSTGNDTNEESNASTVLLGLSNSSFGNGSALLAFSNAVSGVYLLDNGTGFQVGKFHEILPPVITQSPSNTSVVLGKSVTLIARATGDGPLRYQWYFQGNPVNGATNTTLTVLSVKGTNAGTYYITVTNDAGPTSSSEFALSVIFPPVIVTQPTGHTNATGSTATFTVVANGTEPLLYQWQFNGINMAGKTNSSLSVTNLKTSNSGSYRVLVKNAAASVPSALARLSVLTPISITSGPREYLANTNESVLLSVNASGSAPLRYQWQLNGTNITGATTAQYIVKGVNATNIGTYNVVVSNLVSTTNLSAFVFVTTSPFDPNHDGKTDLLIRADDGHLITWFLSGTGFLKNITLNHNQIIDPTWRVAGVSDFNNDGQKDVLFQSTNNGALVVWFMNGTNFIGTANLDSGGAINAMWRVSSVADLDGNGSGDLIAQNTSDDTIGVWQMNGTNFVNTIPIILYARDDRRGDLPYFPVASTNWGFGPLKFIGVGNFHAKGFGTAPDLLTQNPDGFLVAWLMNGTNFGSFDAGTNYFVSTDCLSFAVVHANGGTNGQFAVTPGASWNAVTLADFSSEGETDLIFQSGGLLKIWFMNGSLAVAQGLLHANQPINSKWRVVGPK
ncbi:MAG: hypothetical protein JWM68_2560 [Verrucomicrobiales bacterium]|nr:hypothetical protein [Verrucomicrobiales bacterium]